MRGQDILIGQASTYEGVAVLVTGGAGAVGSNLSRKLVAQRANVTVLDDLSAGCHWNLKGCPNITLIEGSITDKVTLERAFAHGATIVFHLAASFANQRSIEQPELDLQTNGLGTLRLLQSARLHSVERVVYASSCAVYESDASMPLREDNMGLQLTTPYQITKLLGELYTTFFHRHYAMDITTARLFSSYGPGEIPGPNRNVIANFIYWAMKGRPLPITGNGEETRDFTYVGDIVEGLARAGALPGMGGKVFNLASGQEVSVLDVANMINRAIGNDAGIRFLPRRQWDATPRRLASLDRARELLRYEPSTKLEEGLNETIRWFRRNWDRIEGLTSFGRQERRSQDPRRRDDRLGIVKS